MQPQTEIALTRTPDELPAPERSRIRALLQAIKWLDSRHAPTKCFAEAAAAVTAAVAGLRYPNGAAHFAARAVSARSMERYYYAFKRGKYSKAGRLVAPAGTWEAVSDGRTSEANRKQAATANRRFRALLAALAAKHKACSTAAVEELYRMWDNGETIPGYEGQNYRRNMPRPKGWSMDNLLRKMPRKQQLTILREGVRAGYNRLAQVRTTRVGGWPCCVVMFDDVWLDFLAYGMDERGTYQLNRPLQLGALDAFTGRRLVWGTKLRSYNPEKGKSTGLLGNEMLFILCAYLADVGYSRRGTVLVMEHGTAHVSQEIKDKLHAMTGGLVTVEEGGISGTVQPGSVFGGRGVGNPRRKGMLEEWHGLQRNRLSDIATYTGHDRTEPETLHGIRKYAEGVLAKGQRLTVEEESVLSDYVPRMDEVTNRLAQVVTELNNRTRHELSDWEACGFTTPEYSVDGGATWLTIDKFAAELRPAVLAAAASNPAMLRRRNMSPQEAWDASLADPQNELIRFTPAQIAELLLHSKPFPLPAIRGGDFCIKDKKLAGEILYFEACVRTSAGIERELPDDGRKYFGIYNPWNNALLVQDEKGVVLGEAFFHKRVPFADTQAQHEAVGRALHRRAKHLAAQEITVAEERQKQELLHGTLAALREGRRIAPADRADAAHLRRISGKPAARKPLPDLLPDEEFDGLGLAESSRPSTFNL